MGRFCTSCGAELEENANNCSRCGAAVDRASEQTVTEAPAEQVSADTAQQTAAQPTVAPQAEAPKGKVKRPKSYSYSVAALIFGALGGWLGLVFGIIGLASNKEKDSGVTLRSVLGIVFFGLWMLVYLKQNGVF